MTAHWLTGLLLLVGWLTVVHADSYARWELDEAAYTDPAVDSSGNGYTATYTNGGTWGVASQIDDGTAITFTTGGGTSITPIPPALVPADKEYSIEMALSYTGTGQQSVFSVSKVPSPYEGIEVRLNFNDALGTAAGTVSIRDGPYFNPIYICSAAGSYNDGVMRVYKFQRLQRANGSWYIRIVVNGEVVCEKTIASIYVHDHTTDALFVASRTNNALLGTIEYSRFYIGSYVNIDRPLQVVARWEQDEASAGVAVYDSSYNGWDGIQEGGGTFGVTSVIDDGTAITYGASSAAYISSTQSGLYFLDQEFTVEMAFSTDSTGQRTIFGQWQQTANYQGVEAQVNYDGAATTGGDGTIMLRSGDYGVATYACPTPPGYNDGVIRTFRFERRRIDSDPDVWVIRVLVDGVIKCQKTLPSLVTHTYPNPPTYIASRTATAGITGTVEYTRFYIGTHYSDFGFANATAPSVTHATVETIRASLMQAIFGQSTLPTTSRTLEGFELSFGTPVINYNLLNGTGTPWFFDRGTSNTKLIVYAGTKYQTITAKNGDEFLTYCLYMVPDADILALSSLEWPHENRDLSEFLEPAVESLNYAFALRNYTDVTFVGFGSGGWVASVLCGLDTRLTRCFDVAGTWPFFVRAAQTEVVFNEYEERLPGLESVVPADYLDLYVLASTLSASFTQVFNVEDDCCFNTVEGRDYLQAVRAVVASIGTGSYSQRYFNDTDGHVIPKEAFALLSGHVSVVGHWPLDELSGSVVTDVIGGYELNRYSGATLGGAALNGDGGYSVTLGVNNNCFIKDTTVNDFAVRRRPYGTKFWTRWSAGTGPHWNPMWVKSVAGIGPSMYCNYDWAGSAIGYCSFYDWDITGTLNGVVTVGEGTFQDNVVRHHASHRVCVGTEPCQWKLQYFIDGFLYNETDVDGPGDTVMWDPSNPSDSIYLLFAGRTSRVATGAFDDLWFSSGDGFSSTALSMESGGLTTETVTAFWRLDEASAASPAVDSISGFDGIYTAGGTYSVASVVDTGTAITFTGTGGMTVGPTPDGLFVLDREFTLEIAFGFTGTAGNWVWLQMDLAAADDPGIGISVNMYGNGIGDVGCVGFREKRYDTDFIIRASGAYNDGVIRRWKFQRVLISRAPDVWVQRIIADGEVLNQQVIPTPPYHYYPGEDTYLAALGSLTGTIEYTRIYAGPHQSERLYLNATAPCVTADTVASTRAALIQALFDQPVVPEVEKLGISSNSTFGSGGWSYNILNGTTHTRYFNRGTLNNRLLVYHGTTDRTIEEDGGDDFMEYVLHMLPEVDLLAVEFPPWPWEGKTHAELLQPAIDGIVHALARNGGGIYTDVVFVGYGAGGWVADLLCSIYTPITYCFNVAGSWPFYVRNEHTDGLSNGEVFEHMHGLEAVIPCDYLDLYVLASTKSDYTQVFNLGGLQFNSLAGLEYLPAVRAVTASFNDTYKQKYVEDTGGTLTGNRVPPEVFDLVTLQPVARAHWPFDESSGSVAEDVISGYNLSYYAVTLGQAPLADDGGTSIRIYGSGGAFGTVPVAVKPRWRAYSFELWASNTRINTYVKTFQHLQDGGGKYGLYYNYAGTSVTNGRVQWDPQGNPVVRIDATGTGLSDGVARHWAMDRTCVGTEPCEWVGSLIVNGFLDNNASIPVREDLVSAVGSTDTIGICGTPGSYYQIGYCDDARFVVGEGHNLAEVASRIVSGVSETFEARWELDEASAAEPAVESVNGWDATYTAGGTYEVASQVDNGTAITFAGTGATQVTSTPDGLWLLDREYVIEIAFSFTGTAAKTLFGQYDSVDSNNPGAYVAVNYDGAVTEGAVQFRDQRTTDTFRCNTYGTYNDGVMRVWKFKRVRKYVYPTVWVLQTITDNVVVCEKTIPYPLYHRYPGEPTIVAAMASQSFVGTIEYVYIRAGQVDPVATSYNIIVRNSTAVNITATVRAIDTPEYPSVYVKSTVSPLAAGTIVAIYDPVYTIGSGGEYTTTVTISFEADTDYTENSFITFTGHMASGNTNTGTITVIPFFGDLIAIDEVVEGVHPYFPILVHISALGWQDTVAEFNTSGIVMPVDAGMISDFSNVTTTVDENGNTISTVYFEFTPFSNFTDNATVDFTVYNTLFEAVDVGVVTLIGPQFTDTTTLYRNGSQAHKLVAYYRMSTQNLEDTTIPNLVTGIDAAFGDLQLSLGSGVSWNDGGAGLVLDSVSDPQRVISTAMSGNLHDNSDNDKDFAIEVWFRHMSGSGNILSIGSHAFIRHDGVTGLTWEVDGVSDDCTEPLGTETWGGKQLDSANTSYWNPVPVDSAPANTTISFVMSVGANNERDEMPIAPTVEGPGTVGYEPFCYYCQFPPCSMRSESIAVPSAELNYSAWGSCTSTNNLLWEEFQPFVCQGLFNSGASGSSHGEDVAFRQFVHVGTEADHKSFTPSDLPLFSMLQLGSLDAGTWHGIIYQVAIYAADTNQNYYSNNNAADTFIAAGIGQGVDTSVAEKNYEDGLAQTAYTESSQLVYAQDVLLNYTFSFIGYGLQSSPLNFSVVSGPTPATAGTLSDFSSATTTLTETEVTISNSSIEFYPDYDFEDNATFVFRVTSYDGSIYDDCTVKIVGIPYTIPTAEALEQDTIIVPLNSSCFDIVLQGLGARNRPMTFYIEEELSPASLGNLSDFAEVTISIYADNRTLSNTSVTFCPTPDVVGTATFVFKVQTDKGNVTDTARVTLVFEEPPVPAVPAKRSLSGGAIAVLVVTGLSVLLLLAYAIYRVVKTFTTGGPSYTIVRGWALPAHPKM